MGSISDSSTKWLLTETVPFLSYTLELRIPVAQHLQSHSVFKLLPNDIFFLSLKYGVDF